jgi:hypothetical protein
MKERIINLYSDYLKFDAILKTENEKLKEKENLIESLIKGESIEEDSENLKNFYKDSILKNTQLRANFEFLMFLIQEYSALDLEELPKEIKEFYNISLPFKTKPLFKIENEELIVVDNEILRQSRTTLDNSGIFKLLASK